MRRHALMVVALLCASLPASAQHHQTEVAYFAEEISREFSRDKLDSAVVYAFSGPGKEKTELGVRLADEVGAALQATKKQIRIVERAELGSLAEKHGLTKFAGQLGVACWLAEKAGAKSLLAGSFIVRGDYIELTVSGFDTQNCRQITRKVLELALDKERRILLTTPLPAARDSQPDGPRVSVLSEAPQAGPDGKSYPLCVQCPHPGITAEARRAGKDCSLLLRALITKEGHAEQIQVVRPCPFGLTEKTVEAVQKWKLKPATGKDGSPVDVWTPIEIHLRVR